MGGSESVVVQCCSLLELLVGLQCSPPDRPVTARHTPECRDDAAKPPRRRRVYPSTDSGAIAEMDARSSPDLNDPFEDAIDDALSSLPANLGAAMSKVEIVVEDELRDQRRAVDRDRSLLRWCCCSARMLPLPTGREMTAAMEAPTPSGWSRHQESPPGMRDRPSRVGRGERHASAVSVPPQTG